MNTRHQVFYLTTAKIGGTLLVEIGSASGGDNSSDLNLKTLGLEEQAEFIRTYQILNTPSTRQKIVSLEYIPPKIENPMLFIDGTYWIVDSDNSARGFKPITDMQLWVSPLEPRVREECIIDGSQPGHTTTLECIAMPVTDSEGIYVYDPLRQPLRMKADKFRFIQPILTTEIQFKPI